MAAAYQQAIEQVIGALGSDKVRGLTAAEARARLTTYGPNQLTAEREEPAWKRFLAQFRDALVILLLIATAISTALWWYERDSALPYEAIAISAVVLLNAVLGYVQEERAQSAIAVNDAVHVDVGQTDEPFAGWPGSALPSKWARMASVSLSTTSSSRRTGT